MMTTRGRIGVGAALVASIAVAHADPLTAPAPRYAPKGRPPLAGERRAPSSAGFDGVEYLYVAVRQADSAHKAGAGGTILQADPALGTTDFHSLAEIAIESADQRQIVEIGWTVDAGVNGDVQPHVFSYHWVDGEGTCYNACGWVQVSAHKRPGMRVVAGEPHRYEIELVHGDWWLFYDGEAMGYYPQSLWSGKFTEVGVIQWFGEVSAGMTAPCTQMGNGKLGADADATSFADLHVFDDDGRSFPAAASVGALTNPLLYNIGRTSDTGFGFGGPGATAGCCTPTTCAASQAECGIVDDPACAGNMLACGACDDSTCTADRKCPSGVGPRDDGEQFEGPQAGTGGGCCNARGGAGSLVLAVLVGLVAIAPRRRRAGSGSRFRKRARP